MKKQNTVESLLPGTGEYSVKADFRFSFWLLISMLTAIVANRVSSANPELSVSIRVLLNLSPLVPILFFGLNFKRFICRLDEYQRRIQVELLLVVASIGLLINAVLSVLNSNGVATGDLADGFGFVEILAIVLPLWLAGSYVVRQKLGSSNEE